MRIIAGKLGGQYFDSPPGHRTHPMSDRVRGGLFNVLGDITGLTILDSFAGSGALGIEALSRDARHVTFIDIDKSAHNVILKNISKLHIDDSSVKAIRANAGSWSDNNPQARFDIVFCDPPYDMAKPDLFMKMAKHVKENRLAVYSLPPHAQVDLSPAFEILSVKTYGDAKLVFYRRVKVK